MALAKLFHALGDPTRLEMVKRLSSGTAHTLTTVSEGLDISRQGARKHLQVLADANLIRLEPKGRDTLVHLESKELDQAKLFIAELEYKWDKRLANLRTFVEENPK